MADQQTARRSTGKGKGAEAPAADAPKVSKYHNCTCLQGTGKQCPEQTTRAFARGHDARIASRLATAVAQGTTTEAEAVKVITEAGGSDLLIGKMRHSAQLRKDKADGKATAAKEKAEAKAAKPAAAPKAPANAQAVGQPTQVKHGEKEYKAVYVRDAAGALVARHRLQGKNCDHDPNED